MGIYKILLHSWGKDVDILSGSQDGWLVINTPSLTPYSHMLRLSQGGHAKITSRVNTSLPFHNNYSSFISSNLFSNIKHFYIYLWSSFYNWHIYTFFSLYSLVWQCRRLTLLRKIWYILQNYNQHQINFYFRKLHEGRMLAVGKAVAVLVLWLITHTTQAFNYDCPSNCDCDGPTATCEGGTIPSLNPRITAVEIQGMDTPLTSLTPNITQHLKNLVRTQHWNK